MNKDALVLLNGRDKMMKKIYDFQSKNLTAKQQKKLDNVKCFFAGEFQTLAYSFYGLSRKQLANFDANELKELADLLARRARPWAICQILFTFCVPVLGWLLGGIIGWDKEEFSSWHYLRYRRHLKKMLGKDYLLFLKKDDYF
jgi:hypothetical protein